MQASGRLPWRAASHLVQGPLGVRGAGGGPEPALALLLQCILVALLFAHAGWHHLLWAVWPEAVPSERAVAPRLWRRLASPPLGFLARRACSLGGAGCRGATRASSQWPTCAPGSRGCWRRRAWRWRGRRCEAERGDVALRFLLLGHFSSRIVFATPPKTNVSLYCLFQSTHDSCCQQGGWGTQAFVTPASNALPQSWAGSRTISSFSSLCASIITNRHPTAPRHAAQEPGRRAGPLPATSAQQAAQGAGGALLAGHDWPVRAADHFGQAQLSPLAA